MQRIARMQCVDAAICFVARYMCLCEHMNVTYPRSTITRRAYSWPRAADHIAGVIVSSSDQFKAVFDARCSVLMSPVRAAAHNVTVLCFLSLLSIISAQTQQQLQYFLQCDSKLLQQIAMCCFKSVLKLSKVFFSFQTTGR